MKDSFVLTTLIDITETKIIRGDSDKRNQQRNWETVLQVLGLRTQPIILEGPVKVSNLDFESHSEIKNWFGDFYRDFPGPHALWGIKFTSERDGIYTVNDLYNDFEQVPVITGLEDTVRFMLPIFHSYGSLKNIHIFMSGELNTN